MTALDQATSQTLTGRLFPLHYRLLHLSPQNKPLRKTATALSRHVLMCEKKAATGNPALTGSRDLQGLLSDAAGPVACTQRRVPRAGAGCWLIFLVQLKLPVHIRLMQSKEGCGSRANIRKRRVGCGVELRCQTTSLPVKALLLKPPQLHFPGLSAQHLLQGPSLREGDG